ncbi:MAG: hypothetical protein GXW85_04075 [Clostridia bacterium]|nr:hypothetical protein [Clostridia bacterium]
MKEKDFVIAGVIGWVAGPFTFVYLGQKSVIRALVELICILAVAWATTPYILVPFVFGYATIGALTARKNNMKLKSAASQKEADKIKHR